MEGRIHQQKAVEQLQIFGAAAGFDDAHETEDLHPNPTPRLPLPHIQLQFWVHQLGGSCTSADIKKLWSLSELLYHKCVFWKPKKNCWNEHPSKDVIDWREKWWQKSKRSCIFENFEATSISTHLKLEKPAPAKIALRQNALLISQQIQGFFPSKRSPLY